MRFKVNSLSPQIIELRKQGLTNRQIARQLGCSEVNVHKTLKRAEIGSVVPIPKKMRISHIGVDEFKWLAKEADRMRVHWHDLARAMLVDAIHEASEGKAPKR